MARSQPNIVIIMTDQHRADAMGAAGNNAINTPNMDRLAADGVLFNRMYCNSPLCMPARASFVTGRYPHNTGVITNRGQILPQEITFMQQLMAAGYHSALVGKTHFFTHSKAISLMDMEPVTSSFGFDDVHEITGKIASRRCDSYYTEHLKSKGLLEKHRTESSGRDGKPIWCAEPSPLDAEDHIDGYLADEAVNWIDGYKQEKPFFLWVSFAGPHDPWDPPGKYADMYDPADMPPHIKDDLSGKPMRQQKKAEAQRTISDMTDDDARKAKAAYYGNTTLIDDGIGKVLAALDRKGVLDDCLIIYTSDHGEMMGDHNIFQKSHFYEQSVCVPTIIRWPGQIKGGHTSDALAESIDLGATILDTAGIIPPEQAFGRSLMPLLTSKRVKKHRDMVFSELESWKMVCTDRWKYTYDPTDGGPQELYDLENDPQELENLVKTKTGIGGDLKVALLDWLIESDVHVNS